MKKIILLVSIITMLYLPAFNQVYRYIPDASFRSYLTGFGMPFDISGDSLDISSAIVTSRTDINIWCNCIHSIEGVQYFTGLLNLSCNNSSLDSLPTLPASLKSLDIRYNNIRSLPSLPIGLEQLDCSNNPLHILPIIPTNLYSLNCTNDSLVSIPTVPTSLRSLICSRNQLTSLPILPSRLKYLDCSENNLGTLASLPDSLELLNSAYCNLTSLPSLPENLNTLICSYNSISLLPTLPSHLSELSCDNNTISVLPTLPFSLNGLTCSYNLINRLPYLPDSIIVLYSSYNNIDSITQLPLYLNDFMCNNNRLEHINDLPPYIKSINCDSNYLRKLPTLPRSLRVLQCNYNLLDSLPVFYDTIRIFSVNYNQINHINSMPSFNIEFYCDGNNIDSLPPLSNYLTHFSCSHCHLRTLPTLPATLSTLDCSYNNLIEIPNAPNQIYLFNCNHNLSLSCLPFLGPNIYLLQFDSTNIECVNAIYPSTSYYPTIPFICLPYIHSCPSYVSVSGRLFNDVDGDCIIDSTESGIANVTVFVDVAGSGTSIYTSDDMGNYASDTMDLGHYLTHIDTLDLPFTVGCPSSGYDTILIDTSTPSYTNRHFALNCKPGFDLGTTGVINTSTIFRPATNANLNVHAGDMADLYGVHCTNISGSIILNYSGPIRYTGASVGSLIPDTILPYHLVWNISDFSTLDFFHDIKPNFFVDSSALAGDIVCFTTEITPSIGDRLSANNRMNQCFTVVASYDPNIKEVSPAGSITADHDWLYYTIHFQNTGTSYAENIYIWDTIDAQLDINTIQAMGASHSQFMQVFGVSRAVRFNFLQINLMDSSSNEPESHGWVRYRIKLTDSLAEGSTIHNTAAILFDLNEPVITNTTSSTICNTPSITTQNITITEGQNVTVGTSIYNQSGLYTNILSNIFGCDSVVNTSLQVLSGFDYLNPIRMLMYPNPANSQLFIQIEGVPTSGLKIVDMFGRQVYASANISNQFIVDTDKFSDGSYIVLYGNKHEKLVIQH